MIGVFLRNTHNELAFLQMARAVHGGADIAAFHYVPGMKMMTVSLSDKTEETITSEMASAFDEVLTADSNVLVAQIKPNGDLEREYWVKLSVG